MNYKKEIQNIANEFIQSNDSETKRFGKIIIKYIDSIKCYSCLDTKQKWKTRDNKFFATLDGRGQYDIVKCSKCTKGGWLSCSHTNVLTEGKIKIFEMNDSIDIDERVKELKIIHKTKINELDAEWWVYDKKIINQTTIEQNITIDIKKLSDVVSSSIRIYAGDLTAIANLAKDLTIDLSSTLNESNDENEVMRHEITENNKQVYLLMRMEKSIKERSFWGSIFKSVKIKYTLKYMLLIPKNETAIKKCNNLLNDRIGSRIDTFEF